MKAEAYLVECSRGKKSRKFVWNPEKPIALDHPATWYLEKTLMGVQLRSQHKVIRVPTDSVGKGVYVLLPTKMGQGPEGQRKFRLDIRLLQPIRAPYHPSAFAQIKLAQQRKSELFLYTGVRYFLSDSHSVEDHFNATVEGKALFQFDKDERGYRITAKANGVSLKKSNEKRRALIVGKTEILTEDQLVLSTITWGKHWWRINRVITPEAIVLTEFEKDRSDDTLWVGRFTKMVLAAGVAMAILTQIAPWFIEPKRHVSAEPVTIALKKPKVIPKKPEPPKVAVVLKKPEPIKPEKKKPEPVKVAKKPPTTKVKPKVIAKAPPKQRSAPPRPVAQKPVALPPVARAAPPRPAGPPPPDPAKVKAAAQAQARAQLSQSLGFLSPSRNRPAAVNIPTEGAKNYGSVAPSKLGKQDATILSKMTTGSYDGPIKTQSSRGIASATVQGKHGKGLNDVQGKVSVSALYDPNAKDDLDGAIASNSFSMSGQGKMPDGAVEKVLAKYLNRFQYCYEKSLLSNPSLAGTVLMQWTIREGGGTGDIKVIRSALNDAKLHGCLSHELSGIRFPSPKGGPVIIKYPFAFSSSSL